MFEHPAKSFSQSMIEGHLHGIMPMYVEVMDIMFNKSDLTPPESPESIDAAFSNDTFFTGALFGMFMLLAADDMPDTLTGDLKTAVSEILRKMTTKERQEYWTIYNNAKFESNSLNKKEIN